MAALPDGAPGQVEDQPAGRHRDQARQPSSLRPIRAAVEIGLRIAEGQRVTTTPTDPAQLTIATTQAGLATQLATTLQAKAVAAFNTIMGMQA